MTTTLAQDLNALADSIEQGRWGRFDAFAPGPDGKFDKSHPKCLYGHLASVCFREGVMIRNEPRVHDALISEIHASGYPDAGIAAYNDAQRDKRKVVRLVRRAARKAA